VAVAGPWTISRASASRPDGEGVGVAARADVEAADAGPDADSLTPGGLDCAAVLDPGVAVGVGDVRLWLDGGAAFVGLAPLDLCGWVSQPATCSPMIAVAVATSAARKTVRRSTLTQAL